MKSFEEATTHRRSYYALTNQTPIPNEQIQHIIDIAVRHIPSAFNSQTTRVVLLLGEHHLKLWNIVKDTLQKRISPDAFARTQEKVNHSFASGYGTILFFEDMSFVRSYQALFPLYAKNFPTWSQHTNAMHQFSIWTMLEDAGFGVSLQHYNPVIDAEVKATWQLPVDWELIAQMPFGIPAKEPEEKTSLPIDNRVYVFK
jgi:predicted oxidoreductase (fatty acid repression mutant protein)